MKIRMSITKQIYVMITGIILYSLFFLLFSYIQGTETLTNFRELQEKQFKLAAIVDNIKTNLSKMQNIQVQRIVDTMDNIESSSNSVIISDVSNNLESLRLYAKSANSEKLQSIYKKIDLRYSLLLSQSEGYDPKEILDDPEEALGIIESTVAISGKIDEDLSTLVSLSRVELQSALEGIENNINNSIKEIIVFGGSSLFLLVSLGILFARTLRGKIQLLVKGTKAFAQNDFGYRIDLPRESCSDELCELSYSFNKMAKSIEDLLEKQNKANEILDQKVQEQTLKIRQNLEELEKSNLIVMDSINYASKIQHSLLPDRQKMKNTLGDHFVIWNQRDIVGGDFYWMEEVENGYIVALIDCTGHGVPGSLMTMISVPALDRIIREHKITEPSTILRMLNKSLQEMLNKSKSGLSDDGLEMGVCYVNTKEKNVLFASAGIPLFYTKENEIYEIKGDRKGIGYKDTDIDHQFKQHTIPIDANMSFYMATDGITEQVGGEKRRMMFGRKRLRELLKNIHIKAKYEQKNIILETLSEYRGDEPQRDDMTCISFKIENEKE